MNSIEKLDALHAEFTAAPSEDATGAELALRTALMFAGPALRQQIPDQPGDLDDLLERGAEFLLGMRSDDAHVATIAFVEPPAQAELAE